MRKIIVVFGSISVALLVLFQISKFSVTSGGLQIEVVLTIVGFVAFIFGVYFIKLYNTKEQNENKGLDSKKIKELGITSREYEVLTLISKGLSNIEIANQLHLSESTIKTHVSNLLIKLNAKRRTQAVILAKKLEIIL